MKYKIKDYFIRGLDTAEEENYFLFQLKESDRQFKITKELKMVIPFLDGTRDIPQVVKDLSVKEGVQATEEEIKKLIEDYLKPLGVFEGCTDVKKSEPLKLWLHWKLIKGERLKTISKPFTLLFNRYVFFVILITLFVANGYLLITKQFYWITGFSILRIINFPLLIFLGIFSIFFHEFGHAVSAFKYGLKPRSLGVGLYIFQPIVFTDMSEAWALNRNQRVITDIAGVYFQFILSVFISLWMLLFGFNFTLFLFSLLNVFVALLNLDPFSRTDGYWALTDFVGINNAHEKAFAYLRDLLSRKILKRETTFQMPDLKPAAKKFFIGYSLIYSSSIMFFMSLGLLYSFMVIKSSLIKKSFGLISQAFSQQQWGAFGGYLFGFIFGQLIPLVFLAFVVFRLVKYIKRLIRKKQTT